MSIVKGLKKLSLSEDQVKKIDAGAKLHLRHSNIEFSILAVDSESVTIQVKQGKSPSENYADTKTLIYRTKQLFKDLTAGRKVLVHPTVYKPNPVTEITPQWVSHRMEQLQVRIKDIEAATGIDKTNISAWINSKRPMSQVTKAMFVFYFMAIEAEVKKQKPVKTSIVVPQKSIIKSV